MPDTQTQTQSASSSSLEKTRSHTHSVHISSSSSLVDSAHPCGGPCLTSGPHKNKINVTCSQPATIINTEHLVPECRLGGAVSVCVCVDVCISGSVAWRVCVCVCVDYTSGRQHTGIWWPRESKSSQYIKNREILLRDSRNMRLISPVH